MVKLKKYLCKNVYFIGAASIVLFIYYILFHFHFYNARTEKHNIQKYGAFRFRTHSRDKFTSCCDTVIAIILCETKDTDTLKTFVANDFDRQINQTLVMLKSIVMMARYSRSAYSCIKIIVISDKREHFEKLKQEIFEIQQWDYEFTKYLRFSHVTVRYPDGFEWMSTLFRPCATLRLFLPDLLPNQDAIIYLDTDIIFLRDVRDLFANFLQFSNETLGAMAPCLFYYGSKKNSLPYYGSSGLNAGIMLMNLTRMKNTLWTRKIHLVTEMFQHQIKLADQDILNIYFHYYPEELHVISCDWNFRPFQCRQGSYCEDAPLADGISALHGNALSFTSNGNEPLFRTIFQTFEKTKLRANFRIHDFIEELNNNLMYAEVQSHSDCTKYGGLNAMVMNRLIQTIK